MNPFEITRITRKNILKLVEGYSIEQLNMIPAGYNNNLIWHFGHLLVTQQLLSYGLSGNEFLIKKAVIEEFRKGTKPEKKYSLVEIEALKSDFVAVIDSTEEDYNSGKFKSFTEYPTSFGITLKSIQDAIEFNNVHEGLHMGLIMAIRKLI